MSNFLHLPFWKRVLHKKARRPLKAVFYGCVIMMSASWMASNAEHQTYVPHAVWDAVAYFIHGVGGLPIIGYFDPLWRILLGASE